MSYFESVVIGSINATDCRRNRIRRLQTPPASLVATMFAGAAFAQAPAANTEVKSDAKLEKADAKIQEKIAKAQTGEKATDAKADAKVEKTHAKAHAKADKKIAKVNKDVNATKTNTATE